MKMNTLALRVGGLGYLKEIKEGQKTVVAKIQAVNPDELHCHDQCTFECCIPNKLMRLFHKLQDVISKDRTVMLSFLADYRDFYIWNFCTKDDPDRVFHFYVELNKIDFIYIDGIEHSAKDLLNQ